MTFRRLYWVTEEAGKAGDWCVSGVYTSVADLVEKGIRWLNGSGNGFRVSLVKLDCGSGPLGQWISPEFSGLEKELDPFIRTGEFSEYDRATLRQALDGFMATKKAAL